MLNTVDDVVEIAVDSEAIELPVTVDSETVELPSELIPVDDAVDNEETVCMIVELFFRMSESSELISRATSLPTVDDRALES